MSQSIILMLIGVAFVLNIVSFLVFVKKDESSKADDNLHGELILLNRSSGKIIEEIENLKYEITSIEKKLENDDDIIKRYTKQGMNNMDIAKAMNRSVKEIDLIMKMRGNV